MRSVVLLALVSLVASNAAAQSVGDVARRGVCTTSGVEGISRQLIETQQCMGGGGFVRFDGHRNIHLTSSRVHPFVQRSARDALHRAADRARIDVTSAFRTLAEQYVLYHSGACAAAATPGSSNHQSGRAVDVANWSSVRGTMGSVGCAWLGSFDAVHFDCPGSDRRSDTVRAFQRLWNMNHPGDRIAEDGVYGPATASRLARSPAGGFASSGCCRAHCDGDVVVGADCSRHRCADSRTCTTAGDGPRCIDEVCSDTPTGVARECAGDDRLRICRDGRAEVRTCEGVNVCRADRCVDPECPADGSRATLCASDGSLLVCESRRGSRLACEGSDVCDSGACVLEACATRDGSVCLDATTLGECAGGALSATTPCAGGCTEDASGARCEALPCEGAEGAVCLDAFTLAECAGGELVATETCALGCVLGTDVGASCALASTDPGSEDDADASVALADAGTVPSAPISGGCSAGGGSSGSWIGVLVIGLLLLLRARRGHCRETSAKESSQPSPARRPSKNGHERERPFPLAGGGWGEGGEELRILAAAPTPALPRKRGRGLLAREKRQPPSGGGSSRDGIDSLPARYGARAAIVTALLATIAGCVASPPEPELGAVQASLTSSERRARARVIRDVAAENGITQGWLLAGIADAETSMAHCWREATWACQGPDSPDCGGGPVIAGAGDGPCSLHQGGLGMFQFDAGTFSDTLRREGTRILRLRGNIDAGIDFVVSMVIRSPYISGVSTRAQAIAWMNGVRIDNGRFPTWIRTVTHLYNGCAPSYSCYPSRYAHYRDNATGVFREMGADFWHVCEPRCDGNEIVRADCSRHTCAEARTCTMAGEGPRCIDRVCADTPTGTHRECAGDVRLRICRDGEAEYRTCGDPNVCRQDRCVDPECPADGSRATLCASDGSLLVCEDRRGTRRECADGDVCEARACVLEQCVGVEGSVCLDGATLGECAGGALARATPCSGGCAGSAGSASCAALPCDGVEGAVCLDASTVAECAGGALVASETCALGCVGDAGAASCAAPPVVETDAGTSDAALPESDAGVEPGVTISSGCSATGSRGAGSLWLVAIVLALASSRRSRALAALIALLAAAPTVRAQPDDCASRTRFAPGDLGDRAAWTERTSGRWCVRHVGEEFRYALHASEYEAREGNRLGEHAVFGADLRDVELTVLARTLEDVSTNGGADYGLVLGWQNANDYYLALYHPSGASCGIFVVEAGVRRRLASCGSPIGMDERFHHATFRRSTTSAGAAWLEMIFDGRVVAYAGHDAPLGPGRVGIGSMNDAVMFDSPTVAPYPPATPEPDAGAPIAEDDAGARVDDAGTEATPDGGAEPGDAGARPDRTTIASGCSIGAGPGAIAPLGIVSLALALLARRR